MPLYSFFIFFHYCCFFFLHSFISHACLSLPLFILFLVTHLYLPCHPLPCHHHFSSVVHSHGRLLPPPSLPCSHLSSGSGKAGTDPYWHLYLILCMVSTLYQFDCWPVTALDIDFRTLCVICVFSKTSKWIYYFSPCLIILGLSYLRI